MSVRLPRSLAAFTRKIIPLLHRNTRPRTIRATVKALVETDRWNSFDRFHETTRTTLRAFRAAGARAEVYRAPTGGPVGSGRWIIPEAADVRSATVDIVSPVRRRLLDYRQNPWHVVQWSNATPREGLVCELAVADTKEQLQHPRLRNLSGKLVLTSQKAPALRRELFKRGAAGLITDSLIKGCPKAAAWAKFGWASLGLEDSVSRPVGLVLSQREGEGLRKLIAKHKKVSVKVKVDIRRYMGTHDVVSGLVLGRDDPQDEIWAVAHSSEPGALDNASGVATGIEIARLLESLIARGLLPRPRRTIRLLSAYECYGFFHYLEHQRRLQTPLAGVCVDTVGARPELCERRLRWHGTVPGSAGFVNGVGEAMIRAAMRQDNAGYRYEARPFLSTEDTLLGDPQYGFPCPWITNHPCRGYHSSADTPSGLHPRGLATCGAALAGYLYYLADAATPEALELAEWQTALAVERLQGLGRRRTRAEIEALRDQHAVTMKRLRRWWWGGERKALEAQWAACAKRVSESARRASPKGARKSAPPRHKLAQAVARRSAPLTHTLENTRLDIARRLRKAGLSKHALYWADGKRTLAQIAERINLGRKKPVPFENVAGFFEALHDLGYVKLTPPAELISKARLVADLKKLGVKPGMDLMVHSSLSRIGPVAGGAQTVVEALLAALGKRGTLMMPSFNHSAAPVSNPLATPSTNGAIPDAMWRRRDALRSVHPSHAVAAIGPRAEAFCRDHLENGIWASDSPIGRLIHGGGYLLGLGVDNRTSTAYHVGEISLGGGCLDQFGSRDRMVLEDGQVHVVPGLAWRSKGCPIPPSKLDASLDRAKKQRHGKVGQADCFLVKAIEVWKMRRAHLRKACPSCPIKPAYRR